MTQFRSVEGKCGSIEFYEDCVQYSFISVTAEGLICYGMLVGVFPPLVLCMACGSDFMGYNTDNILNWNHNKTCFTLRAKWVHKRTQ